ncbi:MarR family winged helix-turn-helix transcriptional regulator [Veillonella sp.]|uniref:MarR family winged helix-turn-helix transcriptional regulator n=1 Tax=Veillonella sp. TaxID=1926307 RepID=UPI003990EE7F
MTDILPATKDYSRIRDNQMSIFENYARKNGMQSKALTILMWIYYNPNGITQQRITRKTYSTKQVVNATIKNFKDKGYIFFEENPEDKRTKVIKLTEDGRTYAASILDALEAAENAAMKELTAEEQDVLLRAGEKFTTALARNIDELRERQVKQ